MIIHQPHNSAGGYSYNTVIYENIDYDPHFHTNFEMIYVFEGKINAVIGGKGTVLEAGDVALCLSNEIHEYRTPIFSKCWITVFSGDFVPQFSRRVNGKIGNSAKFLCDEKILNFLRQTFFREDTKDLFLITSGLSLLCGEYLKSVSLSEKSGKEFSKINEITDYLTENFGKPITLADTAAALGYERCYFSKMFKNIFGVGFCDYLSTIRFNAAAKELTHTEKTITDVALDSGFGSVRSFNDVFRKKAGMTPQKYRETTKSV